MNRDVVDSLDDDGVLAMHLWPLRVVLLDLLKDLFVGQMLLVILLEELEHLVDDLAFLESAVPDRRHHGIPVAEAVFAHDRFLVLRLHDIGHRDALCFAVRRHQLAAALNILFLLFLLKPLVDLVFGRSALGDVEPVQRRALGILARQNLDLVAVLDHVVKRHELAVDARADHLVADRGMYGVGKINRRRACRQVLHFAARREAVDALGEQIQIALDHREELVVVGHVALPLQNLAQPHELLLLLRVDFAAVRGLLVFPVRRDTIFRGFMHFVSPDLNFKRRTARADQCGVQ